jgi:hypothetical protein
MNAMNLDFYIGHDVVGFFKDDLTPIAEGTYPYEPYRGAGHYRLQTELKRSKSPRCFYLTKEQRVSFCVVACPSYGMLSLAGFEAEPVPTRI